MISTEEGSILILDDEAANVRLLTTLLGRRGFTNVRGFTEPRLALEALIARPADLLVLDLHMPDMDGFDVMREVRNLPGCQFLALLVLTGDESREVRHRALAVGANDFLTKPFDSSEAVLRIRNLLLNGLLTGALARQNDELEERVRQRTVDLEQAQIEILTRLASVAEHHDDNTAEHTRRVARLSGEIALRLGLGPDRSSLIAHASVLHDVGKIAVPVEIIRKPGPLSPEQWEIMRRHPLEGAKMLGGSRYRELQQAEEIARTHHERWDGTGYPYGLTGAEIPLAGRIVAAADVLDALMSARPYKPGLSQEAAMAEIHRVSGTHLDPAVVAALDEVLASAGCG